MASVIPDQHERIPDLEPAAIYGQEGPIRLQIATGGAGQTGVLKALADEFISFITISPSGPRLPAFRIAWLATDTSHSFNALASRQADIAITYHPLAESIAIAQNLVTRRVCLWCDAFNLVGPASNPAHLPTNSDSDTKNTIFELFVLLFQAAVSSASSDNPVRFLSRYDKSANNILESRIWTGIGQTPWAEPVSSWYHRFVAFPREALVEAARLGEYTLVDRGTWFRMGDKPEVTGLKCYMEGNIGWEEGTEIERTSVGQGHVLLGDYLRNPAHALLSTHARDREVAGLFLDWMLWEVGGQKVIKEFMVGGRQLHGVSPERTRSLVA